VRRDKKHDQIKRLQIILRSKQNQKEKTLSARLGKNHMCKLLS
jgi:hypothetical protein